MASWGNPIPQPVALSPRHEGVCRDVAVEMMLRDSLEKPRNLLVVPDAPVREFGAHEFVFLSES
jgi:hypothetical protein